MELAAALHARLGRPARALALYDALLEMAPERTSALLAAGELREAHEQADSTHPDPDPDPDPDPNPNPNPKPNPNPNPDRTPNRRLHPSPNPSPKP